MARWRCLNTIPPMLETSETRILRYAIHEITNPHSYCGEQEGKEGIVGRVCWGSGVDGEASYDLVIAWRVKTNTYSENQNTSKRSIQPDCRVSAIHCNSHKFCPPPLLFLVTAIRQSISIRASSRSPQSRFQNSPSQNTPPLSREPRPTSRQRCSTSSQ